MELGKANQSSLKEIGCTTRILSEEEAHAKLNDPNLSSEEKEIIYVNETCKDIYAKDGYGNIMRFGAIGLNSSTPNFVALHKITTSKKHLPLTKKYLDASNAPKELKSAVSAALEAVEKEELAGLSCSGTISYEFKHVVDTSKFSDKSVHYDSVTGLLLSFDRDKIQNANVC